VDSTERRFHRIYVRSLQEFVSNVPQQSAAVFQQSSFGYPEGRTRNTHIVSVEFLKPDLGTCRKGILLPADVVEQDVPAGTDVWAIHRQSA
jgi:hypothetical protein